MSRMNRVVIADDNREFVELLKSFLETKEDFEIVGVAKNGLEAVEVVEREKPDLLILDIIMPHLDGIGVLEKIRENQEINTKSIVLSAVGQDTITQKAASLGADYYILKPFDFDVFVDRIRDVLSQTKVKSNVKKEEVIQREFLAVSNIDSLISELVHKMGVPAHVKGYTYLSEAIKMVVNDRELMSAITKELYPTIADRYETKPSRVERAIRHAIEIAWERNDKETTDELFGNSLNKGKKKPTNSEFISIVAERVRIESVAK